MQIIDYPRSRGEKMGIRHVVSAMSGGLEQAVNAWVIQNRPFPEDALAELKARLNDRGYIDLAASIEPRPQTMVAHGERGPTFHLHWVIYPWGSDEQSKAIITDFLSSRQLGIHHQREIFPTGIGVIREIRRDYQDTGADFLYCLESELEAIRQEAIKETDKPFQEAKRFVL